MNIDIDSNKFILRNYIEDDLDNFFKLHSNNKVWKFSNKKPLEDINKAKIFLLNIIKDNTENKPTMQALFLKSSKKFIGEAGVVSYSKENRRVCIGYNFLPEYWGFGYATEITRLILKKLFEEKNIQRIEALVVKGNVASEKVLEKNGFIKEGELRNFAYINNEYKNVYFYGIIKKDYIENNNKIN